MSRHRLHLLLPLALLIALAPLVLRSLTHTPLLRAAPALLANPWQGTILLQNRSSAAGNVLVDYYNIATQSIASGASTVRTIPGFGSLAIPLSSNGSLPNGPYSAILSADIPLASVVLEESGTDAAMAYTPNPPTTRLYFPWVRNASAPDWVTRLYLQATDNGTATITFRDANGNIRATSNLSLSAGVAIEVTPPSGLVSAEVSSSVPLIGVARRVHDGDARAMAYPAAVNVRATLHFPLLIWIFRLGIVNVDIEPARISWQLYRIDNGQNAYSGSQEIGPGGYFEIISPDATTAYSAVVSATRADGTPGRIAGVSIMEYLESPMSESYIAFSRGGALLHIPVARQRVSIIAVQNMDITDTNGEIRYYSPDGVIVAMDTFALEPGRSRLFISTGYDAVALSSQNRPLAAVIVVNQAQAASSYEVYVGSSIPAEGSIFQAIGAPQVYIMQNGVKRNIPNPETLECYGGARVIDWYSLVEVDAIPTQIPLQNREGCDPLKYPLPEATVFQGYDTPHVFVMQAGLKRYIPNPDTLFCYGGTPQFVRQAFVDGIPNGSPLQNREGCNPATYPPPEGSVFQGNGTPEVWLMQGGKKRWIPNPDTLACWGGPGVIVYYYNPYVQGVPTGAPLQNREGCQ